jgi:2-polyprenyl-3-methyl-5-hydroxy-6-metoxy-1,4-benzoquinol methylase
VNLPLLNFFQRKRVERNQWLNPESDSRQIYRRQMVWSWEETREQAPEYFARLRFAVEKAQGRVLEIGCGIGNMTRWLAASPNVESVIAIDAFEEAIRELEQYKIPKIQALIMSVKALQFPEGTHFDTVMLCEIIEHLYADEEKQMLAELRKYVDDTTRYVVSTPIGWMPDPHHVRGFTKRQFRKHLARHYGPPEEFDYASGYSQSAFGRFTKR